MRCLARAYKDRPLDRDVWGADGNVVYVINRDQPDVERLIQQGGGIGFPGVAIFEFNKRLYADLKAAYDRGDRRGLKILWAEAKPLDLTKIDARAYA